MSDATTGEPFTIDCDECALRHTDACADCIVTFLCEVPPATGTPPLVVEASEAHALHLLAGAGMVPHLRLVRSGPAA